MSGRDGRQVHDDVWRTVPSGGRYQRDGPGIRSGDDRVREAGLAVSASLPGESTYIRADISDQAQAEGLVDRTIKEYGALDFLVNNAGWTTRTWTV